MTDLWPISLLRPRQITRSIRARTTSGTVATSGFTQRVSVPAHAWMIRYEGILLGRPAEVRAWDAMEAILDGGAVPVMVYIIEAPDRQVPGAPFSDTTLFTDHTGWGVDGATGTVNGVWLAGAPSLQITLPQLGDTLGDSHIRAGHHFSIGERLYRVARVLGLEGDIYSLEIRPPLRDDVAHGAAVSFGQLWCKMRLATEDQMTISIDPAGMGTGNVAFVEDPL